MNYIQYIETTQEWTCPKTGVWKVICVGGGCSGGTNEKAPIRGGATSFGTFVAAKGGVVKEKLAASGCTCGGYGGFDGVNYGGTPCLHDTSPTLNGGGKPHAGGTPITANGYGAGGGSIGKSGSVAGEPTYIFAGGQGALKTAIVDLEKDEVIPCTVGKGGTTPDSSHCAYGADGVIILEYLGMEA